MVVIKKYIKYGDLVRWEDNGRIRVGVVTKIGEDGICSVDFHTGMESVILQVALERLERIVSTIEPEIPASDSPAIKRAVTVRPASGGSPEAVEKVGTTPARQGRVSSARAARTKGKRGKKRPVKKQVKKKPVKKIRQKTVRTSGSVSRKGKGKKVRKRKRK
jgi:hypothetical protein